MTDFITRFAPSPTGRLHLGHAFSAMHAFDAARYAGGTCHLRIEDIDATRCKPEFEAAILDDLGWLGFEWPQPVRRQSEHLDDYANLLRGLADRGVVYRCFKTRKEITEAIARAPHQIGEDPEGVIYPGPASPMSPDEEAERLDKGEAYAWRLSISACREALGDAWSALHFIEESAGPNGEAGLIRARPETLGDVVLGRKDVSASYHLACVHDDALQGVSHVIRGQDLFFVTHLHVLLQALLGLPKPVYRHHRLVLGEDGERLAKRDKALALQALREAGRDPRDVRSLAQSQSRP